MITENKKGEESRKRQKNDKGRINNSGRTKAKWKMERNRKPMWGKRGLGEKKQHR